MPTDIKAIDEYLSKFTFSATSVKPTNIKRLTEDQRRDLYRANKQAFLLMGFTEKEYVKASSLNFSYRKLNKLIGNSIVVNVLQAIFEAMFGDTYMKKEAED